VKSFAELEIGDYVADMHYGTAPLRQRFTVVHNNQWQVSAPLFPFANKELRVLDFHHDGSIVCGYNYDGRAAGTVTLAEKES
jgi:hypothetical protein